MIYTNKREVDMDYKDYEETLGILADEKLSKDIETGIRQIKENKLIDWSEFEKGLSMFTPDFMVDGRIQPELLKKNGDCNSEQETMYLCSIPGMRESLLEARKEPLEESVEDID
jgi:hypothetical protein